jgi:hypothetical protein
MITFLSFHLSWAALRLSVGVLFLLAPQLSQLLQFFLQKIAHDFQEILQNWAFRA